MNDISDEMFYLIQDKELKIRGRYLRFSANIEGLMAKSVILLNETKTKRLGVEKKINLKNFMFNQKLKKFQSLLSEICPDLAKSYHALFNYINTFREMRNKMAHCYFKWDEKDLNSVVIWDLDETSGIQKMEPTKYILEEISDSLKQSMKDIIEDLNSLSSEIIQRVRPEIPHMF
ncbi:MAG TPA: hypothetical protein VFI29_04170 [Hanamia sp.]|nr:hypothetical protein [Hanamia sp.]